MTHAGNCTPDLATIVSRQINDFAGELETTLQWFRVRPSLEDAIRHWFRNSDKGKVDGHQRRPCKGCRQLAAIAAQKVDEIRAVQTFDELVRLTAKIVAEHDIRPQLRQLQHYDFALRVGAYLDLTPKFIYLHSGALEGGAAALEIETWRQVTKFGSHQKKHAILHCRSIYSQPCHVPTSMMPLEFRILSPTQIESLCCNYRCCLHLAKSKIVPY